jgi:hypothetical protein
MACELRLAEAAKELVKVEGIDLNLEKFHWPSVLTEERRRKIIEVVKIVQDAQKKKNEMKEKGAASEVKNDSEALGARPKGPREPRAKKEETDVNASLCQQLKEVRLEEDGAEDKPPPPVACRLCGKLGRFCRGGRKVAYCSEACQDQDWGSHNKACRAARMREKKEQRKLIDEVD